MKGLYLRTKELRQEL